MYVSLRPTFSGVPGHRLPHPPACCPSTPVPPHWLPYPYRISFKLCLLTFCCLNSLAPKYLSFYTKPSLRTTLACLNSIFYIWPTTYTILVESAHAKRFGNSSFSFSAPAAWNSLPKDLHDSSISLLSFKSMLKTHFFRS